MKRLLIVTAAVCGMAGTYWLGRSSSHDDGSRQSAAKAPPAVEITDDSIRIIPGGTVESIVQQSDDGKVQIEGQLTIAPAVRPPDPQSGNGVKAPDAGNSKVK